LPPGSAVFGPAATAELTAIITATGGFIRHVAIKLMTLRQRAGLAWNRLHAPVRQNIERDHSILTQICTNLDHAQHNVTIAMADGRHETRASSPTSSKRCRRCPRRCARCPAHTPEEVTHA